MSARIPNWVPVLVVVVTLVSACSDTNKPTTPNPPGSSNVAGLAVVPASINLQTGDDATLVVEARDSLGVLVANPAVVWRSEAPTVATVDSLGVVRAIAPGNARLTVTSGSIVALAEVSVAPPTAGVQQWTVTRPGFSDAALFNVWDDGQGTTYGTGQFGEIFRSRTVGVWERIGFDSDVSFTGVWGSSPTDIWIVGTGGVILHGDGNTFQPVSSGTTISLLGVWGLSATDVWAVGDQGVILKWNGTQWSQQSAPVSTDLWGIWAANTSAVFVVGNNGVILRYDGQQWRRQDSPRNNALFDVWGTSAGNVFAVGTNGLIMRYDGVTWSVMNTPNTANLFAIEGRAFNDIYATGNTGAFWHFDGTTWQTVSIGNGQNFRGMTVRGDGSIRLGGWYGTVVTVRGVGANAIGTTEISDPLLLSVYSASAATTFAVGGGGTVFKRVGQAWQPAMVPSSHDFYGISGSGANDIVVVGDTGAILRFNGTAWQRETSPTLATLRAVWSTGPNQAIAVGQAGTILRSNGGSWVPQASGTEAFLRAVWGPNADLVYVVGDAGVVLRFDGGRWNFLSVPITPGRRLRAVWGTSANDVYIAGDSGTLLRYDGVRWNTQTAPTSHTLRAIWGRSPTEVYVAGDSGTVLRFNGKRWSAAVPLPPNQTIFSLFGIAGTTSVAAVGDGGRIFDGRP